MPTDCLFSPPISGSFASSFGLKSAQRELAAPAPGNGFGNGLCRAAETTWKSSALDRQAVAQLRQDVLALFAHGEIGGIICGTFRVSSRLGP